jgi:tetratricopeptide (TPR) repeat protein
MLSTMGRPAAAIDHIGQALELYRATGNRSGEAYALNGLAWSHAQLDEFETALAFGQRALAVLQVRPDPACGAQVWDTLGYVHDRVGRHVEATNGYQRALALCREAGNRYGETVILTHLGDAQRAAGQLAVARGAYREALQILDELRHPDAGEVRAKLGAVPAD